MGLFSNVLISFATALFRNIRDWPQRSAQIQIFYKSVIIWPGRCSQVLISSSLRCSIPQVVGISVQMPLNHWGRLIFTPHIFKRVLPVAGFFVFNEDQQIKEISLTKACAVIVGFVSDWWVARCSVWLTTLVPRVALVVEGSMKPLQVVDLAVLPRMSNHLSSDYDLSTIFIA